MSVAGIIFVRKMNTECLETIGKMLEYVGEKCRVEISAAWVVIEDAKIGFEAVQRDWKTINPTEKRQDLGILG